MFLFLCDKKSNRLALDLLFFCFFGGFDLGVGFAYEFQILRHSAAEAEKRIKYKLIKN